VLAGLWWRRGTSSALFAVAAVTMGAAALGPMYARAAGESTLRDQLSQAGTATGLTFQDVPFGYDLQTAISAFDRAQAKAPPPGSVRGYPTRIGSIDVAVSAQAGEGEGGTSALVWRQGACAQLHIVQGRCPERAGQALVSRRTLDSGEGWRLGGTVETSAGPLRIVGSYVPRDSTGPFWFGRNYFDAAPAYGNPLQPPTFDTVFVDRAELAALPPGTQGTLTWDYPLDVRAIRLRDVPGLRREVAALAARYRTVTPYTGEGGDAADVPADLQLRTGLPGVLDAAAHQRNLVDTGTLLVTLQLTLLAWLVLFQVVSDAVESRGNEIALAKLRGFRPRRTVRFTLGEPLALLAAAAPVGFALAWLAAHLFAATVLAPGTPVVLTWYAAAALLAGFAGGALATAAGSYRALTRTVLAQWRRTPGAAHRSALGTAVDVLLALAAVAGLFVLRARHRAGSGSDTAALLAPGLLVIAVALLGTRLLPPATRMLLGPTRASRRIGLFLASRQVARRPAGLRLAALLAVAIGLATFAVSGEAVAAANRAARAQAEVGAARTVAFQFDPRVDPVAAVRRADPDGRWAMAAATWLVNGGGAVTGRVLAVQPAALPAVGYPAAGGPDARHIGATIGASTVPPIVTHASSMRVTITTTQLSGAAPQVQFAVRTAQDPQLAVPAGTLRAGTHSYTAELSCPTGCTLLGLVWNRPVQDVFGPMDATLTVHRIEQSRGGRWQPLDAALARPGGWRAGPDVSDTTDTVSASPDGLRVDLRSSSGQGGITYAAVPQPVPVIATYGAIGGPDPTGPVQMLDAYGNGVTIVARGWTRVLPVVLANGLVADLSYLRTELPDFDYEANWQVWLGPRAPADALTRLRRAGLTLQQGTSTHARIVQLGRQGPALSLFLLLACAIIGAVVAVGGTAVAIGAGARRRSYETAALRVVGVPAGALYRGGVLEQGILLGAAVVLGIPAGAVAARLALPVVPEFADATPVLLRYAPPAWPLVGFAIGFVLLVGATALFAAWVVLRAAAPNRLREGEE
jgi:hypothetical protein